MSDLVEQAKAVMVAIRGRRKTRAVDAPWPPMVDARQVRLPCGALAWQLREGAAEPPSLAAARLTGGGWS